MSAYLIDTSATEETDGSRTYEETWRVRAANEDSALSDPDVPQFRDTHRTNTSATVLSRRPSYVNKSVDYFDVVVQYRTPLIPQPPGGGNTQNVTISATAEPTIVSVWRTPTNRTGRDFKIPANPDNPQPTMDIGGEPVDNRGESIDHPLRVLKLAIPVRFIDFVPVQLLYARWLTRNSKQFDVFVPGVVLFTGWKIDSIFRSNGREFTGDLEFAVDPWFHLRQKVKTDQSGKPYLYGADTPGAEQDYIGRASWVTWYQAFPYTSDLTDLLRYF